MPDAREATILPPTAYILRPSTVRRKTKLATTYTTISSRSILGSPGLPGVNVMISFCPSQLNMSFSTMMRLAEVNLSVSPLARDMVASVIIKGLTLNMPINTPFNSPKSMAEAMVAAMPSMAPIAPLACVMTRAPITPESATLEPTERSIPPVSMMNVIPMATIASVEVCVIIFMAVETEKNAGVNKVNKATSMMSIPPRYQYRLFLLNISFIAWNMFIFFSIHSCAKLNRYGGRKPPP